MFTSLFLGVALAASSLAIQIPRGVTDGSYIAYINSTGHEVHELIAVPSRTIEARRLNQFSPKWYLEPRPTGLAWDYPMARSWCGCEHNTDELNTAEATADLYKQIYEAASPKIVSGMSYYSIRGTVVAFVCNYTPEGSTQLDPKPDWVSDGADYIDEKCGRNIAGTWEHQGGFGLNFGRMRMEEGLDFCRASISSPASECLLAGAQDELDNLQGPGVIERV